MIWLIIILWVMVLLGYSTVYFSDNSNFINKLRSLLPLIIGIISIFFIKHFSIFSPLSLMLGYGVVGMLGAFYSTRWKRISWWWAVMFISPILLLYTISNPFYIYILMNVNWVIASLLSLGFITYFLIQPGVIKGITLRSLLTNSPRPFEGWFGLWSEDNPLKMVITRPTGLARYSAISSLVMLCLFITYDTWYLLLGFIIFILILLLSKGRTEMLAFIVVMGLLLFYFYTILLIIIYLLIIIITFIIIFGNVTLQKNAVVPLVEKINFNKSSVKRITTLSGRTDGVWNDAKSLIKKQPLTGYGFGSERYLLKDYKGDTASVDSAIFNALLQSGIIGTAFFVISLIVFVGMGFMLFISGNNSLMMLECVSVGIFILLRGITQSFSSYSADWLFLVPLITYIQLVFNLF